MAVRLEEQLLAGVSEGDISRVNDLLSKKPDVNYKNKSGQFPLLVAIQKGHKDIVQRLVDEGADVNMCGVYCVYVGRVYGPSLAITSLSLASEYGYYDIVEVLIEKGAEVDRRLQDDRTPLMIACRHGHVKTVEVLLSKKKGAEIDLACSNGVNALLLASFYGHKKVVELLLQRGASVGLQTSDGHSALILATDKGHVEVVKVLLDYNAEVDLGGYYATTFKTALMIACENKNLEIVKLLFTNEEENPQQNEMMEDIDTTVDQKHEPSKSSEQSGSRRSKDNADEKCEPRKLSEHVVVVPKRSRSANVNIKGLQGYTALHFACISGDVEIVQILIKHGADVNPENSDTSTRDYHYKSPLLLATLRKHTGVVQVLLENGANPDSSGNENQHPPPLILATANECVEIVELLLKHKANVDITYYGDNQSVTPLMLAIFSGHLSITKLLVKNGANVQFLSKPTSPNNLLKLTCLHFANALGNKKLVNILESAESNVTSEEDCREYEDSPEREVPRLSNSTERKEKAAMRECVDKEHQHICRFIDVVPRGDRLELHYTKLADILPKEVDIINLDSQAVGHTSHVSEEPSINNTFRSLLSVAAEWENIGILLNIKGGDLSSIKADHTKVRNCLREMLKLWLKRVDPPPTWEELTEAIKLLGEAKLAAEIKEKYITV